MIEKQYLANRIANANEAELVAIVYEGLIDSLKDGIDFLSINAEDRFNKSIEKSREILAELLSTLEGNTEIANNLRSLYFYINQLITDASIKKDAEKLELAIKVITPVYEGWKELGAREGGKDSEDAPQGPQIVAGITYGKGQLNDYVVNNDSKWKKG
ncbi:MAG: flagellar export chaperone FliS [Clostridiales bacterium]|nr:flagellar export chaperone FliS [Clostridiales bacterium]